MPSNTRYPHEFEAKQTTNKEQIRQIFNKDYVCATYKFDKRDCANFLVSDCLALDCDNDHSDDPNAWITPENLISEFDNVFMIFHRTELSDTQYLGGLGTANSITTSNYQSNNPVIQRIGLSREVILSDPEELLSHLRFQQMDIDFTNESKRLYHTIKKLLRKNEADPNGSQKINDSLDLEIFIPEIIRSNFVKLTKDVLEHNYLYNNQVKSSHDSEWFRIIRDSRNRKEKTIGNTYGNELEEMER